ncbi:MAG: hypothetical protein AAF802_08025 [Planctomycetota bacterium]
MSSKRKVEVENINHPGLKSNVDGEKYEAMKIALMRVLPSSSPGMTQKEMMDEVISHLPEELFPGGKTSGWWVKTVQLDLEAKQLIGRTDSKPLTWYRTD